MSRPTRKIIADKLSSINGHYRTIIEYYAQIAEMLQDERPDLVAQILAIKDVVTEFKEEVHSQLEEIF